jgi:parvulin-like peptidyl-prolyl isomerase
MRRALLLLLVLFLPVAYAAPKNAFVIDKIVATVGSETILLSEVNFEARVALIDRAQELGLLAQIDDGLRKSVLQDMIIQTLLYAETKRLRAFEAPEKEEAEIKTLRALLQKSLGDPLTQTLEEFSITDKEFDAYLKRRFYADRLLTERVSGPMSEEEIATFYRENPQLFGDKTLREARADVIAAAQKQIMQARLFRFLEELKNRFSVRIFFK